MSPQKVDPQDLEGDIRSQEGPLKGATAEVQLLPLLTPALDLVPTELGASLFQIAI